MLNPLDLLALPTTVFEGWRRYFALEPWGTFPADHRTALLAAFIGNASGGKKGGRAYQPEEIYDALPWTKPRRGRSRKASGPELLAQIEALNAQFGGRDLRHLRVKSNEDPA